MSFVRPYLAVIKDSFRAAVSSWVLYVMLGLITIFLVVIAPIGYQTKLTTKLYPGEVVNEAGLIEEVAAAGKQTRFFASDVKQPLPLIARIAESKDEEQATPAKVIWQGLGSRNQGRLTDVTSLLSDGSRAGDIEETGRRLRRAMGALVNGIDDMLAKKDFYDPEKWKDEDGNPIELPSEAQKLYDKGPKNLSETETRRMNRLALEAAFPESIEPAGDAEPTMARRIWTNLSRERQDDLVNVTIPSNADQAVQRQRVGEIFIALIDDIDDMLRSRDFYDEGTFDEIKLDEEGEELAKRNIDDLSSDEVARLNRLAFDAAFAGMVRKSPQTSMQFYYFIWDSGQAIPMRKTDLATAVNTGLPWILDWIVLPITLLIAVLVTAFIIPTMMEPGSINLLLSKPLSRSALYTSKFVGGCAFMLICAVYLFGGVWLIMGLRLGIWHYGMLLCIPVYVFAFAIYYSVSALAGLIYKNSIVSIIAAIVFYAIVWLVGGAKYRAEGQLDQNRIKQIVAADDEVFYISDISVPHKWDKDSADFERVFISDLQEERVDATAWLFGDVTPIIGPVYDEKKNRLVAVQMTNNGQMIVMGRKKDDYDYLEVVPAPPGTIDIFMEPSGNVVFITFSGQLWRMTRDPIEILQEIAAAAREGNDEEDIQERFDLNVFERAGPVQSVPLSFPQAFAMNADNGMLAIYNRGTLTILQPNREGVYERVVEDYRISNVQENDDLGAALAFGGDTLLLARGDGRLFDLQVTKKGEGHQLKRVNKEPYRPVTNSLPRFAIASPDGRWFAVVYHNRTLYLLDTKARDKKTKEMTPQYANLWEQGDISTVGFASSNRILVGSGTEQINEYSLAGDTKFIQGYEPPLSAFERAYRWIIVPVYWICPKPGEFYQTINQFFASEESEKSYGDLTQRQQQTSPWMPVVNGVIFIAVMLVIGCIYFEREEY